MKILVAHIKFFFFLCLLLMSSFDVFCKTYNNNHLVSGKYFFTDSETGIKILQKSRGWHS